MQSKIFLREQELTEFDASLIAQCLKSNSSVTLMDLSDNSIGNRGTASIAESLRHHSSVKRLVFPSSALTSQITRLIRLEAKEPMTEMAQ